MSESKKPLETLDSIIATLILHGLELTSLSKNLQESIKLLNPKKLAEEHETLLHEQSSMNGFLKKMDKAITELQSLGTMMQRMEADTLQLEVSKRLSQTHLKTYQILSEGKGMTATEIASLTHRSRATETIYLNQMAALGFVEKTKKERRYHYKKKPQQPASKASDSPLSEKVMILVMVSERPSEDSREVQELVSRHLSDLENWRIERSTIISR